MKHFSLKNTLTDSIYKDRRLPDGQMSEASLLPCEGHLWIHLSLLEMAFLFPVEKWNIKPQPGKNTPYIVCWYFSHYLHEFFGDLGCSSLKKRVVQEFNVLHIWIDLLQDRHLCASSSPLSEQPVLR